VNKQIFYAKKEDFTCAINHVRLIFAIWVNFCKFIDVMYFAKGIKDTSKHLLIILGRVIRLKVANMELVSLYTKLLINYIYF